VGKECEPARVLSHQVLGMGPKDAGAFQVGIGVTVLLALAWNDALLVALTGFAVASGLHTISHSIDRHMGGHDSDVPVLGLFTLIALIGIAASIPRRKR
jgi:hypothetical protein